MIDHILKWLLAFRRIPNVQLILCYGNKISSQIYRYRLGHGLGRSRTRFSTADDGDVHVRSDDRRHVHASGAPVRQVQGGGRRPPRVPPGATAVRPRDSPADCTSGEVGSRLLPAAQFTVGIDASMHVRDAECARPRQAGGRVVGLTVCLRRAGAATVGAGAADAAGTAAAAARRCRPTAPLVAAAPAATAVAAIPLERGGLSASDSPLHGWRRWWRRAAGAPCGRTSALATMAGRRRRDAAAAGTPPPLVRQPPAPQELAATLRLERRSAAHGDRSTAALLAASSPRPPPRLARRPLEQREHLLHRDEPDRAGGDALELVVLGREASCVIASVLATMLSAGATTQRSSCAARRHRRRRRRRG